MSLQKFTMQFFFFFFFCWPNPSSIRLWRTGVQCHGMWAHNLESFSFRKIFLNKTTERGIEPSTFRVEISKLNQDVPTELPRPLKISIKGLEAIKSQKLKIKNKTFKNKGNILLTQKLKS